LDDAIVNHLALPKREANMSDWQEMIRKNQNPKDFVRIGIVGKYVEYEDSYKSLNEALYHGGLANQLHVELKWVESEGLLDEMLDEQLGPYDGILIPGGFGKRGIDGMIRAAKYARTRKVPYFGICLGMECAVIEFARNVCGLQADSSEFDPAAPHRVFYMLRELLGTDIMGGNMRLGAYPCELDPDSLAHRIYGKKEISERHRHRYEFNREYEKIIVSYGMKFSGNSPDGSFVEIAELPDHPWYLGCQFHPEFKSKPMQPHPLFADFIAASYRHKLEKSAKEEHAAVVVRKGMIEA
jgi:CTP synthase